MLNRTTLAQNIKLYRKIKGMTQTALADALFVTPQTVSKWESAQSIPDLENLCLLAQALGVKESNLLDCPEAPQKFMIGIDGGGTKTAFVLVREDGTVIHRIRGGSCNPNVIGIDATCKLLKKGIDSMLSLKPEICCIFAGIAGVATGEHQWKIKDFLNKHYRHINCFIENDILNVIASVRNIESCTAVICGTGSVAFGYKNGKLHRFGGHGYLLDNAGSGFDIGRDVIKHCLDCHDGFTKPSLLKKLAEEKLGAPAFDSLQLIYAQGIDYIASFAPLASEAARQNDSAAIEILKRNMKRIGELISRSQEVCGCGKDVIFAGGISKDISLLLPYLLESAPGSRFIVPEMSPVYGACINCFKNCKCTESIETFEENYKKSYSKVREVTYEI